MDGVILVYDGQCPLCSVFSQKLRLERAAGGLELVDARSDHYLLPELKRRNIDLNQGMVVLIEDQIYQGVEATQILASMTRRNDLFNRCIYKALRRRWTALLVYPLLKLTRRLLLILLWRKPIP